MSKFFELFTNSDGRASTTGFIQFFGFLVMAGVLIYAVYLDRSTVTDLFFYFACFCGGSAATKGAVMAWNGMEWNQHEWNGTEWNGMGWNGME